MVFERTQIANALGKQYAIEVVDLVLNRTRQQAIDPA